MQTWKLSDSTCNESNTMYCFIVGSTSAPREQTLECQYSQQDPKDGELYLGREKLGETLVEARSGTDVQIVRQTWVQGRKTNRTIQQLVPSEVSLRIAGVEQFYQVKRMIRGLGDTLSSTYSQTLNG